MFPQIAEYIEGWTDQVVEGLEHNMRPGRSSEVGFLNENDSLIDTIMKDAEILEKHGVTHEMISDLLTLYVKRADRSQKIGFRKEYDTVHDVLFGKMTISSERYRVDDKILYESDSIQTMGYQECPFQSIGCDYEDNGHMFSLINETTGESIHLNNLIVHMIKEHYFFEGRGTDYRLEPEKVNSVLDIANKNHTIIQEDLVPSTQHVWKQYASCNCVSDSELKEYEEDNLAKNTSVDGVTMYLMKADDNCIYRDSDSAFFDGTDIQLVIIKHCSRPLTLNIDSAFGFRFLRLELNKLKLHDFEVHIEYELAKYEYVLAYME